MRDGEHCPAQPAAALALSLLPTLGCSPQSFGVLTPEPCLMAWIW